MTMNTEKTATVIFKQFSAISVKPKSLNLGKVKRNVMSEARTVTIKNTGTENIFVDSIDITGTHKADFDVTSGCALSLYPQASCEISVTITAQGYGKREALLQILSNAKTPVVGIKLKAKAEEPKISASPRSLNFGNVSIGSSSPTKIITIKNTGISAAVISSVTLANNPNNEFAYSTPCSTIGKGETCIIEVTFVPVVMGLRTAQIEFKSNDPDGSPLIRNLKGKGH
jgi:hypothetical protein